MSKLSTEELRKQKPSREAFVEREKNQVILILDGIQSSHNIGAMIRLSDAFLLEKLVICGEQKINPKKLRKTSIGTQKWVTIEEKLSSVDVITELKLQGYQIASIELCQNSIIYLDADYQLPIAFVLGSEKFGVSDEVIALSDMLIHIPMFGMGNSMNVSSAGAIVIADCIAKL
ncbi:MAG: RNA methyltransferase [Colwellia sp.]|nr:RNA methyltransferase [Colwellia sp.]